MLPSHRRIIALAATAAGVIAAQPATGHAAIPQWTLRVIQTYPHDAQAFTQGLVWRQGGLFESTGNYGASTLRAVRLTDGVVERSVALLPEQFGEGLAWIPGSGDGELIQLTWREGVALRYDAATFAPVGTFPYTGQGWGLCYDGQRLIMSDGTSTLTFRDPATFAVQGSVQVTGEGLPQRNINELECVDGTVWANIWQTDLIVGIDPGSGRIIAEIDAAALADNHRTADVLNGIAYRPDNGHFLFTGKNWPALYEVEIAKAPPVAHDPVTPRPACGATAPVWWALPLLLALRRRRR